ncbi:MAG TPA: GNAT family N-acetyltransferase [Acetobacteraceae bacterium]|jgi:putative acetyltransferase|nr:GNAT family N-acetyltransferase [Acetobacteraceae bacterium]
MIRRATPADVEAVARLHQEVRAACLPYLPDLHAPAEVLAYFRDRVFPTCEVWAAGTDTLDGYCAFRPGWVDHLYIRPERHHLGFGTALLGQAMAANSRLLLWTFQRNAGAIAFYRARGFRLVRETDGSRNEEHEPDALLEWTA